MKCPKCGYLGFETTERCRHCGYDFSLSVPVDSSAELPLRPTNDSEAPLADFDLDRIFGEPEPLRRPQSAVAVATPPPGEIRQHYDAAPAEDLAALPLFTGGPSELDDQPTIAAPPPARPPLAVRRATPEVARRRTPRTIRREADGFELQLEPATASADHDVAAEPTTPIVLAGAPRGRRVAAAVLDIILLGAINLTVLYLTLAIAGLSMIEVFVLPPIPMASFLLLLNGGYLVAFTAANGQTIGKMLFAIRVIGDADGRIDIAGAVLRAAGVLLTLVTLGLPYLPVLLSRDGRALHDRLAGTRVIKHA